MSFGWDCGNQQTHGEFHVHVGGDEKLKNYFAWPYLFLVVSFSLFWMELHPSGLLRNVSCSHVLELAN